MSTVKFYQVFNEVQLLIKPVKITRFRVLLPLRVVYHSCARTRLFRFRGPFSPSLIVSIPPPFKGTARNVMKSRTQLKLKKKIVNVFVERAGNNQKLGHCSQLMAGDSVRKTKAANCIGRGGRRNKIALRRVCVPNPIITVHPRKR